MANRDLITFDGGVPASLQENRDDVRPEPEVRSSLSSLQSEPRCHGAQVRGARRYADANLTNDPENPPLWDITLDTTGVFPRDLQSGNPSRWRPQQPMTIREKYADKRPMMTLAETMTELTKSMAKLRPEGETDFFDGHNAQDLKLNTERLLTWIKTTRQIVAEEALAEAQKNLQPERRDCQTERGTAQVAGADPLTGNNPPKKLTGTGAQGGARPKKLHR